MTLTATNTGTGLEVETVTDADGAYTFRNLLPGTYDVKASLAGFREYKQTGLAVSAGTVVRVNIALEVGALTETVQVAADTTLLQTDKADLSTQLTSKEITDLPLNQYRNYQALINLVPGATPAQFQNALIDTPGQSLRTWVNGTQPNSNATRIDGAVSVNIWLPHHVGYVQPAETIETVNVATNSFDAEYGMAGGAAATVVTKSGTNQVRGSAFWFGNNDKMNANSFFNNAFDRAKDPLTRNIYGGTVGGPVVHNKLFYFGSIERFADKRGSLANYGVPTARMRNGDFGEVAAAYAGFRLYNPNTGGAGGVGRELFPNNTIPSSMINPIARAVLGYYPMPNTTADLNSNQLADDYQQFREVRADRDNYDMKMTWQRNASHSVWGKFAMLDAKVIDNFSLGFDEGSRGDTRVYVATVGHTWTLSPTLVLDGNFGANIQNQEVTGPDFGDDLGLGLGIRGTNGTDVRQSGLPHFAIGANNNTGYNIGTTPNWMPLFRKERSYTFGTAVTKVFQRHDVRLGVDVVRHALNHIQAEFGDIGGVRGGFRFNGTVTGAAGYTPLLWNEFGTFLLGLQTYGGKDVQTEEMTGREWQSAIYIRDRWQVSSNFTISAGLRRRELPADVPRRPRHRAPRPDHLRGAARRRRQHAGRRRHQPEDLVLRAAARGDVSLRREGGGARRLRPHHQPAAVVAADARLVPAGHLLQPHRRPVRGARHARAGHPGRADSRHQLGAGHPPARRLHALAEPEPGRSRHHPAVERRLRVQAAGRHRGRSGLRRHAHGRRLRRPEPELRRSRAAATRPGSTSRLAGTAAVIDWAARTKSRYHGLQVAVNRPLRSGLLLKGAYTFSRSRNMSRNDEDGWTDLTWNTPLMYDQNYAIAGFDRPHVFQMGVTYALPFLMERTDVVGRILQGWQINGIASAFSGTPFSVAGTNTALNCQGCGNGDFITINYSGDASPTGTPGINGQPYYPLANFSQPTGADVAGFGNTLRNYFRRPSVWNVDMSVFKSFQIGRWRPEFRLEAANVFNHTVWGRPIVALHGEQLHAVHPAEHGRRQHQPAEHARVAPHPDRAPHAVLTSVSGRAPPAPSHRSSSADPPRGDAATPRVARRPGPSPRA